MVRHLFALSLMGILAVASGCSLCSDAMDDAPNYQGGLYGHEDMLNGRIGSAFTTTTVVEQDVMTDADFEQ